MCKRQIPSRPGTAQHRKGTHFSRPSPAQPCREPAPHSRAALPAAASLFWTFLAGRSSSPERQAAEESQSPDRTGPLALFSPTPELEPDMSLSTPPILLDKHLRFQASCMRSTEGRDPGFARLRRPLLPAPHRTRLKGVALHRDAGPHNRKAVAGPSTQPHPPMEAV